MRDRNILDEIKIATPCTASWDNMTGDERTRFCGQCKKNVYNISDMSRAQAEKLFIESEGKACLRLYRRADGTVITDDCPIGLRKVRNAAIRMATTAASLAIWFRP